MAAVFGAGGATSSYQEMEDTDFILLWGSNARETHPILFHHLLKAVRRGAPMVVVDPRRTSSAQFARVAGAGRGLGYQPGERDGARDHSRGAGQREVRAAQAADLRRIARRWRNIRWSGRSRKRAFRRR